MNIQLWTVGGSKAQGKNMKKKTYWTWGSCSLATNLLCLWTWANHFLKPLFIYSKTSQSSCSTRLGKYMLEGLENYQIAYHHHCSGNSQLKTWRVLKECQDELAWNDLAVWILLIHKYTEFCSLLNVFYHWFKCWKKEKKEEEEGRQVAVWEETNFPPPSI